MKIFGLSLLPTLVCSECYIIHQLCPDPRTLGGGGPGSERCMWAEETQEGQNRDAEQKRGWKRGLWGQEVCEWQRAGFQPEALVSVLSLKGVNSVIFSASILIPSLSQHLLLFLTLTPLKNSLFLPLVLFLMPLWLVNLIFNGRVTEMLNLFNDKALLPSDRHRRYCTTSAITWWFFWQPCFLSWTWPASVWRAPTWTASCSRS